MFAGKCIAGRAKCWRPSAACPRWTGRKPQSFCGGRIFVRGLLNGWRTSRWPARPRSRAGLRFAHGAVSFVLPGPRSVRKHAPFSRPQRAKLGQLVGGSAPTLRQRTAAPRHVSSAKIFQQRGVGVGMITPVAPDRRGGGACQFRWGRRGCLRLGDKNGRSGRLAPTGAKFRGGDR